MAREERKIETDVDVLTEADFESAEWGDYIDGHGYLRPKFDSVAAWKLHQWSLESFHNEEHGNAVDWHRWSALFRNVTNSESSAREDQRAAILSVDSQGFVTASWHDGVDAERAWWDLEEQWRLESEEEA